MKGQKSRHVGDTSALKHYISGLAINSSCDKQ